MADFAKRPEVTIETMGKVHNPSGAGVRAVSTQVKNKTQKIREKEKPDVDSAGSEGHETKVKDVGTARRNITRKKSTENEGTFDNSKKKQGGHGKGKWLDVHDGSLDDYADHIDKNDPLYDETEEGKYILSGGDAIGEEEPSGYYESDGKAIYGPMLTLPEFKIRLAESIREYFDSGDSDEVIRSIEELKCRSFHPEVVKKAISLSLDEGPRERELISRLLTCLHPTPLSDDDMEEGFEILLQGLEELSIDCPDAKTMVGSFLARAVVDEVLPPAYLSTQNNERPGDPVVEKAVSLLSREHCTARLEHVWGPGDGRPVAELKTVLDQLLKEYLMSRELDEAARCVREMNATHFHHELVKRGVTHAMETADPRDALDAMSALFSFLTKNAIVSEYQVAKGISRLNKLLPDLSLDIPTAPELLADFEGMVKERALVFFGEHDPHEFEDKDADDGKHYFQNAGEDIEPAAMGPTLYEWKGVFATPDDSYKWIAQKVGGAYADDYMYLIALTATAADDAALDGLETKAKAGYAAACEDTAAGTTVVPTDGKCYKLIFDQANPESTWTINTASADNVAFFAQHVPTEFEDNKHYFQTTAGVDVEPGHEELSDGGHAGHSHAAGTISHGETCGCEQTGDYPFVINCLDTDTIRSAMADLSSCPKTTACKTDSKCQTAFFVIQAHHDHCKHDTLTTEEEKAMHAYETYCTNCQIYRAFAEGNKDCFFMPDKAEEKCAELVADPTVVNTALSNLESECTKGETGKCCESDLTKGAFATIVTYHDLCDPSDVPENVENAFHDYEHGCEDHFCNMIDAIYDGTKCDSVKAHAALFGLLAAAVLAA